MNTWRAVAYAYFSVHLRPSLTGVSGHNIDFEIALKCFKKYKILFESHVNYVFFFPVNLSKNWYKPLFPRCSRSFFIDVYVKKDSHLQ